MLKKTMTVGELISLLQEEEDKTTRVFATWEGVLAPITEDCFDYKKLEGGEIILKIDVNTY